MSRFSHLIYMLKIAIIASDVFALFYTMKVIVDDKISSLGHSKVYRIVTKYGFIDMIFVVMCKL